MCIYKGDVQYLDLIGKDEFSKHPNLRIPVSSNDPRRTNDYNNIVNYVYASDIINDISYNDECKERFVMWNLYRS